MEAVYATLRDIIRSCDVEALGRFDKYGRWLNDIPGLASLALLSDRPHHQRMAMYAQLRQLRSWSYNADLRHWSVLAVHEPGVLEALLGTATAPPDSLTALFEKVHDIRGSVSYLKAAVTTVKNCRIFLDYIKRSDVPGVISTAMADVLLANWEELGPLWQSCNPPPHNVRLIRHGLYDVARRNPLAREDLHCGGDKLTMARFCEDLPLAQCTLLTLTMGAPLAAIPLVGITPRMAFEWLDDIDTLRSVLQIVVPRHRTDPWHSHMDDVWWWSREKMELYRETYPNSATWSYPADEVAFHFVTPHMNASVMERLVTSGLLLPQYAVLAADTGEATRYIIEHWLDTPAWRVRCPEPSNRLTTKGRFWYRWLSSPEHRAAVWWYAIVLSCGDDTEAEYSVVTTVTPLARFLRIGHQLPIELQARIAHAICGIVPKTVMPTTETAEKALTWLLTLLHDAFYLL